MRFAARILGIGVLGYGLFFVQPLEAERLLARRQGVSVYIADDFSCSSTPTLTLRAPRADVFTKAPETLEALIAGACAILAQECGEIADVLIDGEAGGRKVFHGMASSSSGWALIELPPEPEAGKGAKKGRLSIPGLPLHGYNRPEILAATYLGKLDDIPDDQTTREWIYSYLKALADACGAPPIEVNTQAMHYVRYDTFKDAGSAMTAGLQQFLDLLQAARNVDIDALAEVERKRAIVIFEANQDGRTLIDRHGCTSNQVKQFQRNIFQIVGERSSYGPDRSEFQEIAIREAPPPEAQPKVADKPVEAPARREPGTSGSVMRNSSAEVAAISPPDSAAPPVEPAETERLAAPAEPPPPPAPKRELKAVSYIQGIKDACLEVLTEGDRREPEMSYCYCLSVAVGSIPVSDADAQWIFENFSEEALGEIERRYAGLGRRFASCRAQREANSGSE